MSAVVTMPLRPRPQRHWLLPLLLASAFVVANEADRLLLEPVYDDLLSEEIHEQAKDWRAPPEFESEWRAPEPKPKTRMTFGYDSAYEARRARERAATGALPGPVEMSEPVPNTLFRLEF